MGLDIYVGSLTRYYAGDWELIAQQAAREMGMPLQIVRPQNDPGDAIRDPVAIRPVVKQWRDQLSESLAGHLSTPLGWNEEADASYFTDKPTGDCYSDLLLWAAYSEHPDLVRPEGSVEDFGHDPRTHGAARRISGHVIPISSKLSGGCLLISTLCSKPKKSVADLLAISCKNGRCHF